MPQFEESDFPRGSHLSNYSNNEWEWFDFTTFVTHNWINPTSKLSKLSENAQGEDEADGIAGEQDAARVAGAASKLTSNDGLTSV